VKPHFDILARLEGCVDQVVDATLGWSATGVTVAWGNGAVAVIEARRQVGAFPNVDGRIVGQQQIDAASVLIGGDAKFAKCDLCGFWKPSWSVIKRNWMKQGKLWKFYIKQCLLQAKRSLTKPNDCMPTNMALRWYV
jgi:hypothetical protein